MRLGLGGMAIFPHLLFAVSCAHAAPLLPAGPPSVLISQAEREALGLRIGPDSIVDLMNDRSRTYLVFSGSINLPGGVEHGDTFRLAVDPTLSRISGPLQVIMRPACQVGRAAPPAGCGKFDSDYAGAGSIVTCPQGTIYMYHGENHTPPGGQYQQGVQGWTGIGQAHWDPSRGMLVKDGQVAGLNASNAWRSGPAGPETAQTNAASGNPSVVRDRSNVNDYLYFGDRSDAPDATGRGMRCERRTCWAVARADHAALCAGAANGHPANWQIWHNGAFAAPALLPDGTGSAFTPMLNQDDGVDNLANVTKLPGQDGYVMVSILRPGDAIVERTSSDGLHWSRPATLVASPTPPLQNTYPRILPLPARPGAFVLTYVVMGKPAWQHMELMRQELK